MAFKRKKFGDTRLTGPYCLNCLEQWSQDSLPSVKVDLLYGIAVRNMIQRRLGLTWLGGILDGNAYSLLEDASHGMTKQIEGEIG